MNFSNPLPRLLRPPVYLGPESWLDTSVCNNKQRWNEDKCKYECKELIDKGVSDIGFIWNPNNCECEWNKSCDIGEYLNWKL